MRQDVAATSTLQIQVKDRSSTFIGAFLFFWIGAGAFIFASILKDPEGLSGTANTTTFWVSTAVLTVGIVLLVLAYRYTKRVREASSSVIVATATGIDFPLVLLDSYKTDAALKQGRSSMFIKWEDIRLWVVSPGPGDEAARYELTMRSGEKIHITRPLSSLRRRESNLVAFVRDIGKIPVDLLCPLE